MRLLLASLFFFGALIAALNLLDGLGAFDSGSLGLLGPVFALAMLGLIAVTARLFNRRNADLFRFKTFEQQVRELEQADQLVTTTYTAVRAFAAEEFEDEGSHYFLELVDGRVLFLTGQYLYETDPTDTDPRRFPCTEFTLRHHRSEGHPVDIQCRGTVLEPELTAPAESLHPAFAGDFLADGEILTDPSYDELKSRLASSIPA
jgi:hypothetical protein